jgi:hypothetical protein
MNRVRLHLAGVTVVVVVVVESEHAKNAKAPTNAARRVTSSAHQKYQYNALYSKITIILPLIMLRLPNFEYHYFGLYYITLPLYYHYHTVFTGNDIISKDPRDG